MKRLFALTTIVLIAASVAGAAPWDRYYIEVATDSRDARQVCADAGMDIHHVSKDRVLGIAGEDAIEKILLGGLDVTYLSLPEHEAGPLADFPSGDAAYHNYDEMVAALQGWAEARPDIVDLFSIGNSLEGRALWTVKISDNVEVDESATEGGVVIVGQHHAREHIAREVPLALVQYLIETYDMLYSSTKLVESKEIWVTPTINPDGAEYDIATGSYQYWRKNRRDIDSSSCYGIDLNRNYGYHWGEGGSSGNPCDETYRGATAFSEPETVAFRAFVQDLDNADILITYHNYGELVMYPWGYTSSYIPEADRTRHRALGQVYANYSGYTLQQSSSLYTTSGDTCDWSYGELGITSFTVEVSPSCCDFYVSGNQIQNVVNDNLPGMLHYISEAQVPGKEYTGAAVEPELILDDLRIYRENPLEFAIAPAPEVDLDTAAVGCGVVRVSDQGHELAAVVLLVYVLAAPGIFLLIRRRAKR